MGHNGNDSRLDAIFVADSHFHVAGGAAEGERLDAFVALLGSATRATHLVLLGDIFDFWFDYPHFRLKGYDKILAVLDRVHAAGTQIHFVGGNHDIWAAGYLHQRYGSDRRGKALTLDLAGVRVRCQHGDGMLGKEVLYRAFRAMVRNPAMIRLAKALHPELLFALSTWLSGHSRQATRDEAASIERKATHYLERAARASAPWDIMVMGHVHHAFTLTRGSHTLMALGGWL
jgi:UDP-2,3-diacylglucosamine hydrolase